MAEARQRWREDQPSLDPARLVFIDETGTSTNMTRLRGRGPRGARVVGRVPHGHWKITTFVAGLRCGAVTAPFVIDRPMNGLIFRTYLERCLIPTLTPGDIVIMDNLSAHKVAGVREAVVDGRSGALVDSPDAFRAAWIGLAADHDRRRAMGILARERAQRFGWDQTVENFLVAAGHAIEAAA